MAEIGSMHKGEPSLAYELIRQAARAGATIAKFQFGWTKEAQEKQGHTYKELRYCDPFVEQLAEWCEYFNIELMASIWSYAGLETARKVGMKRYKIAHQIANDAEYSELIWNVLRDDKPTFISNNKTWMGYKNVFNLFVIDKYPVYPKDLGVLLPSFGEHSRGYSDHSHGIAPCLLAVARGAKYIEKHFCLDKTDLCVRDTPFSATPGEFAEMVGIGEEIAGLVQQ